MEPRKVDLLAPVLLVRLRQELGDSVEYRKPPKALAGGKFSSVCVFELGRAPEDWSGPFVLRLVGPVPDQVRLEAGLHDAARAAGLRSPRVLLWDPAGRDLGEPFMVMERLPGRSYLRGVEPWRFALDFPKLLISWPERFTSVLEAIGRVDANSVVEALEHHGVPERLARPGRHLDDVAAALDDEPGLGPVISWLQDNRPDPPPRLALVHGDLWPANVFLSDDEIGLVDWTRGAIDDPALDVGFAKVGLALMPEPFPPPPPVRQLVRLAGMSVARRISARADEMVGGRERVRYYEALRCAVELAGVVVDRRAGNSSGWAHGVPALVQHLERLTNRRVGFS